MRASWKADKQLCTGTNLPSVNCYSAQQLVASSLSFYLSCTLSESHKFLRYHKLHNYMMSVVVIPLS